MKNKSNVKRGGAIALAVFSAFCLLPSAFTAKAGPSGNGSYLPPQGLLIDGTSTTTVTVGGTNLIASVCLPNTTNYFNLTGANGSQVDTNAWPKQGFTLGRDEGTPSRVISLQTQFACGGASAGQEIFRFAGSVDGIHWQTNPCPFIWTVTANGTTQVQVTTNVDLFGLPFFSLYSRENTNAVATAFMTNHWINAGEKVLH